MCVSTESGIICDCPSKTEFNSKDGNCIVKNDKCNELFKDCTITGGTCASTRTEIICDCPTHTVFDTTDRKCTVTKGKCDEQFKGCTSTGGTCASTETGITCNCPIDTVFNSTSEKCIVPNTTCDTKKSKCRDTRGYCEFQNNKIECVCPAKMKYNDDNGCQDHCTKNEDCAYGRNCVNGRCECPSTDLGDNCEKVPNAKCTVKNCISSGGSCEYDSERTMFCNCNGNDWNSNKSLCVVKTENCLITLPNCSKTGGSCKATQTEIICECPSGKIANPTKKQCNVTEKKCKEDLPKCLESGGSCESNETGIYCKCPADKVSDDSKTQCFKNQCVPNPCRNGGTCLNVKGTYKCNCIGRYEGDNCSTAVCFESEKQSCNNVKCVFDELLKKATCICGNAQEFDEALRVCKEIDPCIKKTLNNECDKLHETCKMGNCTCEENYKYSENGLECVENFCAGACPANSDCEELGGGRTLCTCHEGFYEDGNTCKKINPCSPGRSGCAQKCLDDGTCDCYEGFNIDEDGISCRGPEVEPSCNLKCGVGKCIKKAENKFECGCPAVTHIFNGTTCVDICSSQNSTAPAGMCPSNKCEPDDRHFFKCKCEDLYELADDRIHCRRKIMCEQPKVIEICAKKAAVRCEELPISPGFNCICEQGSDLENNVCTNKCQMKVHKDRCEKLKATCELDSNYEPVCKCPPLLTQENPQKPCDIKAPSSYFGRISVLKNKYEIKSESARQRRSTTDGIDLPMLKGDMLKSLKTTYDISADNSRLSDLKLLHCDMKDKLVTCSLELQFNKERDTDGVNKISSDSVCVPIDEEFCLLKPNLIMHRIEKKSVFHKTNPCADEEIKLRLCGNSTNCTLSKEGDFQCRCKKEFHTIGSFRPIPGSDSFIQKCNDINECAEISACPPSTDCINQYGGHDCRCKDGYKKKNANSDPKLDGCDELCNPDPCGKNGECLIVGHHGFSCNCSEGYTGLFCNTTIPVTNRAQEKTQKAAIVGGVLGVIMFVMIIVGFVIYRKMKKSKGADEEYAINRQRGILSEVSRLRRQEDRRDDFPNNEERPRPLPRNGGGNRARLPEERMIPRVQATRQRSDVTEGRPSPSGAEVPGRSRRDEAKSRKTSSQMQYRNEGYDEEE